MIVYFFTNLTFLTIYRVSQTKPFSSLLKTQISATKGTTEASSNSGDA